MFTSVNEEVAALEKFWTEEGDLDVLRARLTIRLEGLKARYRQSRPGFNVSNIRQIESLFEGLKLLDGLERHLVAIEEESDPARWHRHAKDGLRLAKLIGSTKVGETALQTFRKKLQSARQPRELGWHPQLAPLYSVSSAAMASATC